MPCNMYSATRNIPASSTQDLVLELLLLELQKEEFIKKYFLTTLLNTYYVFEAGCYAEMYFPYIKVFAL